MKKLFAENFPEKFNASSRFVFGLLERDQRQNERIEKRVLRRAARKNRRSKRQLKRRENFDLGFLYRKTNESLVQNSQEQQERNQKQIRETNKKLAQTSEQIKNKLKKIQFYLKSKNGKIKSSELRSLISNNFFDEKQGGSKFLYSSILGKKLHLLKKLKKQKIKNNQKYQNFIKPAVRKRLESARELDQLSGLVSKDKMGRFIPEAKKIRGKF